MLKLVMEYYSILLNGEDFITQSQQLKKLPGFDQVSRDLFPKLRAAKIEIVAKPIAGLDQTQSASLKKALEKEGSNNTLNQLDWSIAGETSPRLDDKAEIYSKMTFEEKDQFFTSEESVKFCLKRLKEKLKEFEQKINLDFNKFYSE